jgi:hypothetical protein
VDIASERELREQWQRMHEQRHEHEHEARELAEKDINRRLEDMNEFRRQLASERLSYVQRDWYDREHNTLRAMIDTRMDGIRDSTDTRLKALENASSNWQGRWWAVSGLVALAIAVGALVLRFFKV